MPREAPGTELPRGSGARNVSHRSGVGPAPVEESDPIIEFRTLGAVDLTAADGGDLTPLIRQPKRLALLAYLLIAGRGAFVRRDKLLALFWPEVEAERARSSLRTNLHRLRVMLGADAIVTRGPDDVRVNDALIRCDANILRDASDAADHEAVLARYAGELLDGLYVLGAAPEFEQWLDRERGELRQRAIRSGWEMVSRRESVGDPAGAADIARRVLRLDRTDELGMRRLLGLLIAAGDRAGAATAYEEFRRGVAAELDIEPAPETRAIAEALRVKTHATPAGAHRPIEPRPPSPVPPVAAITATAMAEAAVPAAGKPARAGSRIRKRWLAAATIVIALATLAPFGSRRRAPAAEVPASRWQVLDTDGPTPFPRWHPVVVLDSTSRNLLLFGGREWWSNLSDLWRGSVDSTSVRWTRISARDPEAGPGGRWLASAVYNPRTDRLILFGGSIGYTAPCTDELWILEHVSGRGAPPSWTKVPRSAEWPAPRADHRMAYDAASNRLMLLGGHDCIAPTFDDYWILKNADGTTGTPTWERVVPDTSQGAPRGVRGFALGYNAASNRAVVFGGYDHFNRRFFHDAWVLTHANGLGARPAWQQLKVNGESPPGRINAVSGYDAAMNRLVVAQGDSSGVINDAWVLVGADGTTPESRWQRLGVSAPMPDPRYGLAAAFDAIGGRLFVFPGGDKRDTPANWVLLGPMGR
jgi:DNA-binding SARP family transcriptional activator